MYDWSKTDSTNSLNCPNLSCSITVSDVTLSGATEDDTGQRPAEGHRQREVIATTIIYESLKPKYVDKSHII